MKGEKSDIFWDFYKYNERRKLKLPYEQLEKFLNLNQQKIIFNIFQYLFILLYSSSMSPTQTWQISTVSVRNLKSLEQFFDLTNSDVTTSCICNRKTRQIMCAHECACSFSKIICIIDLLYLDSNTAENCWGKKIRRFCNYNRKKWENKLNMP